MKKQTSKRNLKNLDRKKFIGLGKDYGLIFKGLGIRTSRDGKRTITVRKLLNERDVLYHIYFDKTRNKLYYTEEDSMGMWHRLYEWPAKIVKDLDEEYGNVSVEDMIRYKSSLLLALRKKDAKDIIVDLAGNKIAFGSWIEKLTVFNKELYHIDRRGLVRTELDEVVIDALPKRIHARPK